MQLHLCPERNQGCSIYWVRIRVRTYRSGPGKPSAAANCKTTATTRILRQPESGYPDTLRHMCILNLQAPPLCNSGRS